MSDEQAVRPIDTHGPGGGKGVSNSPVNTRGTGAHKRTPLRHISEKAGVSSKAAAHGVVQSSKIRGRT